MASIRLHQHTKGNVNLTALKIPFHKTLSVDQEISISIMSEVYDFTCVGVNTKSNNDGTVDEIYVLATNHQ